MSRSVCPLRQVGIVGIREGRREAVRVSVAVVGGSVIADAMSSRVNAIPILQSTSQILRLPGLLGRTWWIHLFRADFYCPAFSFLS